MVKLRQLIRDLPHLLLLSLTFVAALPTIVNGETQLPPPLTPTNFKETVGKGYWFIEHFSPHCWHCRNFLPTWTKLYEMNENGKHPGMHMAQVDCAVNGDLCNDNGVKGYPTLQMWQDGKYIGKFDGMRELDLLTEYLDKYAPSSAAKKDTPPLTTADTPAHIAPTLNTNGEVLDLTGAIFEKTLEQGPAFVKFYAPWCGHCKKLAPIWKSLATALQDKLTVAEVNCEVEKTLCASQGIEGYPSLVYYTAGSKTDYQGGRKLDQLTAFAIKARSDSTEAITAEEVEHYVQKQEIVYTLLHSDPAVLKTLLPLFSTLLGEPKVFTVAGASPDLFASYGLAKSTAFALIAFKDHQFKTPASIYQSPSSALSAENKAAISSWLLAHRLPTTVELTRDTFQSVMNAKHAPLVVIAPVTKDTKDLVKEKFLEISGNWRIRTKGTGRVVGKDGKEREVIFAWMDVERWKDWMSSMYGLGAPNSASVEHLDIVVADHQSLVYYNADESGAPLRLSSMDSLFTGLEGIANERIGSIHSENLLERGVRFLNGVITGLEGYVTSHPFKTVAFFGVFMIALGFFLRQYVLSDIEEEREHLTKKGDRLD